MVTKRDLVSSLIGMTISPLLLIGLAYAVGGKAVLAPFNVAVEQMLQWVRQNASPPQTSPASSPPATSEGGDAAAVETELPQAVADGNEGMEMTVREVRTSLLACPSISCRTVEILPAGSRVTLLGRRVADGEMEWSSVRFRSEEGWVTRQDLE